MIIFPKEMKFLYDHHRKGDEPWRKIPTGICKARRHYIDSKEFRHLPPATRQDNDRYRRTYSENSVPCHHPQQKRLCFIWSSSCRRRKSKNPLFWIEKGWNMHVKRTCSQAHLPIARRSNGCTKQAVLLTLLPRSSSLPDLLKSVTSLDSLCITVAGPCRSFTGLPY